MIPGSSFLSFLNNNPNSGIADYYVPQRVGIIVTTNYWYLGGPLRLAMSPGDANYWGNLINSFGYSFLADGDELYSETWNNWYMRDWDPDQWYARLDLAIAVENLGWYMVSVDPSWCQWIHASYGCDGSSYSDGFIPIERQYYTWSGGDDAQYINVNASHVDEPCDPFIIARIRSQVQRTLDTWY